MNPLPTLILLFVAASYSLPAADADGTVIKHILDSRSSGHNLLKPGAWQPYTAGFEFCDGALVCDNGTNRTAQRGAVQTVILDQSVPRPIVVCAWSRADAVDGARDSDYSLYVDLLYVDGTPLWGQVASFATGSHGEERRELTVFPEKPVKSLSVNLLLRRHAGKASFRGAELHVLNPSAGAVLFDGVTVAPGQTLSPGFELRDVAAGSDFVKITRQALGVQMECKQSGSKGAQFFDVALTSTTTNDRALTLVYTLPVQGQNWQWLAGPRLSEVTSPDRQYVFASPAAAGMGLLSRFPFAAISNGKRGLALGIDMEDPALFRAGFNTGTHELFLAYDLGFAPEKPHTRLRFVTFEFDPAWEFRSALARYYELFPAAFACRTPRQGIWMPFAKISSVPHWEDFGFRFKEGNDETAWDAAHDIVTFRYTEALTWWMSMSTNLPRTLDSALAEARRLAGSSSEARALETSGFRDDSGHPLARLLDTPWCNGAVWSMNSMPGIAGPFTDFKNKWNPQLRDEIYGSSSKADLDGEYIDSSEGDVADVFDFRRDHFIAAQTPLTFSPDSHRPAIFRGLIALEYARAIARDVHALGKLMMANATPDHLCWLAPLLDVMGTETDWNPGGHWQPMSDTELLYRRALCRAKPFCFLMNTRFDDLPAGRVEDYMRRCLAYGMFPGFFSADASRGHYFTRPELYERDRPLFKKYVPLCRLAAEAGWQPLTRARSSDPAVHLERFGTRYLTVYNDSADPRSTAITLDESPAPSARDLVGGANFLWHDRRTVLTLAPGDVALLELSH